MSDELPFYAFDLPNGIDPDPWARALLEQIERDIRQGRRKATDRPAVYFGGASVLGPTDPYQVIAERDAYRSVVGFDIRHFDAYELTREQLPPDIVPVSSSYPGPGRTCCFGKGLWRVTVSPDGESAITFTNVSTGEVRTISLGATERIDEVQLDQMYATDLYRLFLRSGDE